MNILKLIIAALILFSVKAHAVLECTKPVAKGMAYSAIKDKFPSLAFEISAYEISDHGESWAVFIPAKTKGQRGGGMPEATVIKETCKVTNVHLSRQFI